MDDTPKRALQPRFLWFLTMSYAMVLVFANWFDPRLVRVFGLVTDAGTLIFPLTFLLADLITEVYGYKIARRAIWIGLFFNLLFMLYGQLVIHLPSPKYPTHNDIFAQIIAMDSRVVIASVFSYLCSEPLNTYILAKIKILMRGKLMWLRFVSSTVIASGLDSCIFGTIAFYGVLTNYELFSLIVTMWLIKVVIEIIGLPVSVTLARKLKAAERVDIYDIGTNFNLFSFDVSYSKSKNKYKN
ncbi:MAG: queuosine precursor transporter [Gammaproteobacteria bacterium]|jgi:uncharacterized integral membrane protein (TIGR00697 family)